MRRSAVAEGVKCRHAPPAGEAQRKAFSRHAGGKSRKDGSVTMPFTRIIGGLSVALFCSAAALAASPSLTFVTVDYPGSAYTSVNAVNVRGQAVGAYLDASGNAHAFELDQGRFTTIDDPIGPQNRAFDINNAGEIVGAALPVNTPGFQNWLLMDGNYTNINGPAGLQLAAQHLNDRGDIVGFYTADANAYHGFLLSAGVFTTLDYPGAPDTALEGINDRGEIVGDYFEDFNATVTYGFSFYRGNWQLIHLPIGAWEQPFSINNAAEIVGIYFDSAGVEHGYRLSNGRSITVDVPGAVVTEPHSINDRGQISGKYEDASGAWHGFIASPVCGSGSDR